MNSSVEQEYCVYCDKPLKKVQYVNFAYASEPIAPFAEPEHGQYGYHPVGPCCAKKNGIPKAWIFTKEDAQIVEDRAHGVGLKQMEVA